LEIPETEKKDDTMRVVILGCGRVGSELAKMLCDDKHEVSVIDWNPTAFKRLSDKFTGRTIIGAGIDTEVLEKAGIREADAFVSCTNGDNTNIMAALIAREEYHVPQVVIRIYDPLRTAIYRQMGLNTICPTLLGATHIYQMIQPGEALSTHLVDEGAYTMLEITPPAQYVGQKIRSLPLPEDSLLAGFIRAGTASTPLPDTRLEPQDRLIVLVKTAAADSVRIALKGEGAGQEDKKSE